MTAPTPTPLDLLLPYQRKWVDDPARFKIGCMARQTGKDFSSAAEIVRDCMTRERTSWMIAAPSERQALESLDKCRDWSEAFNIATEGIAEDRDGPGMLLKSGTIQFPDTRSRIIAVPGRPDTVRGFSVNLLLTEFAFFDDPNATWKAVLPSITNPLRGGEKMVRLISTPNGKGGRGRRFFEIIDANLFHPKPGRAHPWSCHLVTIEDAVRLGLPINIAELREALDDDEAWAQEYMCEFLDSSNVLLPYDLIATAESIEAAETADPEFFAARPGRPIFCGIDFGRTNDPAVCWTLEKIGSLLITREVLVLRNIDSPSQQAILRSRIAASRRTCFDYTGPGIGLGDYLAKEHGIYDPKAHRFGRVELCTFTTAFKRLIFPRLRRVFEPPVSIRVPISIDIREDLHAMQQIIRNGEYTYSAPRTAQGHSDRCTAAALAVRAASSAASGPVQAEAVSTGTQVDRNAPHKSFWRPDTSSDLIPANHDHVMV